MTACAYWSLVLRDTVTSVMIRIRWSSPSDYQIMNSCFFNSDLPCSFPDNVAFVVVGGGGLIYQSQQLRLRGHLSCITWYLDEARKRDIPWGFLSCGLQLRKTGSGL